MLQTLSGYYLHTEQEVHTAVKEITRRLSDPKDISFYDYGRIAVALIVVKYNLCIDIEETKKLLVSNLIGRGDVLKEEDLFWYALGDVPFYYHDMMYWALYSDLEKRIPKLDEIITNHAHLLTGTDLYNKGGLHDILFLLKSFDLDIRKRYPLGTVFSYGRQNEFQHYTYLLVAKETQSKIVEMVKDIQIGDVAYIVHKGLRTIGHTTSDIVDKALRYDTIRRHRRNMNRKQTKASQDSEVKQ